MTEADNEPDSDGYSLDDLDDEQLDELAEELESRLDSRDKEEIKASLGMFKLEISTHESLDDAVSAFESVWRSRISEITEAEADTVRNKLSDERGGGIFIG